MKIKCEYYVGGHTYRGWLINTFADGNCHVLARDGSIKQLPIAMLKVSTWRA